MPQKISSEKIGRPKKFNRSAWLVKATTQQAKTFIKNFKGDCLKPKLTAERIYRYLGPLTVFGVWA
jgi:hypothetical protein